jgi:hypothetical protein
VSHSSRDSIEAMALKAWLERAQPGLVGKVVVDLDPATGIPAGVRWNEAPRRANDRCEAVICPVSKHWDASHECRTEDRGKPVFPVRLESTAGRDITSKWQTTPSPDNSAFLNSTIVRPHTGHGRIGNPGVFGRGMRPVRSDSSHQCGQSHVTCRCRIWSSGNSAGEARRVM